MLCEVRPSGGVGERDEKGLQSAVRKECQQSSKVEKTYNTFGRGEITEEGGWVVVAGSRETISVRRRLKSDATRVGKGRGGIVWRGGGGGGGGGGGHLLERSPGMRVCGRGGLYKWCVLGVARCAGKWGAYQLPPVVRIETFLWRKTHALSRGHQGRAEKDR